MSVYVKQNHANMSFDSSNSWVVMSGTEQSIKRKIEAIGTPLSEWDINIYRGILTGCNEAFIISGEKKDELISADPKSAELIRPILRGRDIKRYKYTFADLWLINVHNGLKSADIPRINIENYPAIKEHLNNYFDKLATRADKGDTPYNLRNCAYMDDFFKQKIVWGNLCLSSQFALVEEGMYINAPSPMIVPGNKYLLAILNSKLADWYIRQLGVTRNGGYFEYKPMFVEKLPVPILAQADQIPYIELSEEIIQAKKNNEPTIEFERILDNMVFNLYELSEQEKSMVAG